MPKVMKTCRVCGRLYEACRTVNNALGVFRWQEVACSPECGSVYLQKLNESRGIATKKTETESATTPVLEPAVETVTEAIVEPVKRTTRKRKVQAVGVTPLRLEVNESDTDTVQE